MKVSIDYTFPFDDFTWAVSQWVDGNCKVAHRACVIFMKATNNADFVME